MQDFSSSDILALRSYYLRSEPKAYTLYWDYSRSLDSQYMWKWGTQETYKNNGVEIKTISNNENQLGLDSFGVKIFESSFTDGENEHIIEENCYHSMFILSGNLNLKNQDSNYQQGYY